jgi:hypothetical protein
MDSMLAFGATPKGHGIHSQKDVPTSFYELRASTSDYSDYPIAPERKAQ